MTTLTSTTGATASSFELRSGPHTIAGPGENCLVCGDPLSPGEVYLFVSWDGMAGVAHEDCAELEAAAAELSEGAVPGTDPAAATTGNYTASRLGGGGAS